MKRFLALLFMLSTTPATQAERSEESVIIIRYEQAAALLDEGQDNLLEVDHLQRMNNLPATATGNPEILFISAEEADLLLGEPNESSRTDAVFYQESH